MRKTTLCAVAALATVMSFNPAQAENPRSTQVGYGDLDLQSAEGVARLDRRIAAAINHVCNYGPPASDRLFTRITRLCMTETLASVEPARNEALRAYRGGKVQVVATLQVKVPMALQ